MIDLKYEILEYLYEMPQNTATLADILNLDISNCDKRYWAVKDLADARNIIKCPSDPDRYRLSGLGFRTFFEERDKRGARKRDMQSVARTYWYIPIIIGSVIGCVGGCLVTLIKLVCN